VDLDHKYVLAQDGLPASETNPQFHQQMVYAVAMNTILQFEQALGRVALWSTHNQNTYVQRLRIYPHALRDRNAYYSPEKKALLFGYFTSEEQQGSLVFTCLSHDIVAHETTHALLDGVHPRFHEAVNGDVLAFHEGFADLVALFLHFTYPSVVEEALQRSRGVVDRGSVLAEIAREFGHARSRMNRGKALRSAIDWIYDPANRDEAVRILAARVKVDEAAARGAVEGMTQGQSALQRNGEMDLQGLRNVIMLRERYGVPQKKMGPPSKYYDPTWYDLARARR
jgi:hypothetical protein